MTCDELAQQFWSSYLRRFPNAKKVVDKAVKAAFEVAKLGDFEKNHVQVTLPKTLTGDEHSCVSFYLRHLGYTVMNYGDHAITISGWTR